MPRRLLGDGGRGPGGSSPVVLLLDEVVACPEGHQVGVVGRGRDGHRPGAAHVRVTQLVRQALQLIRRELVVVPQHVVVRRAARALHTRPESVPP